MGVRVRVRVRVRVTVRVRIRVRSEVRVRADLLRLLPQPGVDLLVRRVELELLGGRRVGGRRVGDVASRPGQTDGSPG